ncbi:coronafacic acid polyketide synthase I (plasmid) [Azospirillum sp. B510]|uniref:type I polyketide synthase n=1 Tax=Azospirillum sp. (strain B510) TaxID=137722 RepID=UPI0001C4B98E|nr:type I polyketide synthase [Azospirillum sp. B510]BAI73723.1 coronafacic acid polyketide synthase I [Azospirillum sp. B510]
MSVRDLSVEERRNLGIPLVVSGATPEERQAAAQALRGEIAKVGPDGLRIFCLDRLLGAHATHRGIVLADNHSDFDRGLSRIAQGRPGRDVLLGQAVGTGRAVFVFPGQASAWSGMASGLFRVSTRFRDALVARGRLLEDRLGMNPAHILATGQDVTGLARIQGVQFALAAALADLWEAFGVTPAATLGHSVGEVGAMRLAGHLDDRDAVKLLAMWADALTRIEGRGAMASVSADAEQVRALIAPWADRIGIAAYNSPRNITVSGDADALDALLLSLARSGLWAQRVPGIEVAGHSHQVEALREQVMRDAPERVSGRRRAEFWSTIEAAPVEAAALDAAYWYQALRRPVRFEQTIARLAGEDAWVFIEASAHPVLTTLIEETLRATGSPGMAVASLDNRRDDAHAFLNALARAFVGGVAIGWAEVFDDLLGTPERGRIRQGSGDGATARIGHKAVGDASDPDVEPLDVPWLARQPEEAQKEALRSLIVREAERVLRAPFPADARAFVDAGFNSLAVVEFVGALAVATGLDLPATILYDHASPDALIALLRAELGLSSTRADASPVTVPPRAVSYEPIAIVGMACRYPGGIVDPEGLWELVGSGRSAVGDLPANRGWNLAELYDPDPDALGRISSKKGGFLRDPAGFDAAFFGISPREAAAMEPQQRLLLETSWEAIERAGLDPDNLKGRNVGVFVGVIGMEYGPLLQRAPRSAAGYSFLGKTPCVASGRISYTLGLEGPALAIDTACSSSLVAIHTACGALRDGDCDLALAGGATIMSTPGVLIDFSRQRVLSPDGRCKAFAAAADGIGLSEGVGMLMLARLSVAEARKLPILAVIRSSAVNQDGASNGLTAPNGSAQVQVIRRALAKAGLRGRDVDVIEAHGTGTTLGDPIEAHALLATYGADRNEGEPAYLGSIKSNIAHTQAAAGVAGVIKMVMAMRHGRMPLSLNIDAPSDRIAWSRGGLEPLTAMRAWPERADGPRRAAVSSFGVSGTNAHLILEASTPVSPATPQPAAPSFAPFIWPVAGRTPTALLAAAARLLDHVRSRPSLDAAAVARTLGMSRAGHPHRAAIWGGSRDALVEALENLVDGQLRPRIARSAQAVAERRGKLVFVFSGQGSQWPRMGMALATMPAFRAALDHIDAALRPFTGWSVIDVLDGAPDAPSMERVDVVQPALFAVMVALARLWRSLGILPSAVIGHSQGEIAAAHVAGILDLSQAARIVAVRSRVLHSADKARGAMANLFVSEPDARALIAPFGNELVLATFNGPRAFGVSGTAEAIDALVRHCADTGVTAKRIPGNVAPHCPALEDLRSELRGLIGPITPSAGEISFYSTVDGHSPGKPTDGALLDADYWCDNLCRPVRFSDAVAALASQDPTLSHPSFLECSPHPVLSPLIEQCAGDGAAAISTLQRGRPSHDCLAEAAARLYVAGHRPDWAALYPDAGVVDLPTYPFERRRFWIDAENGADVAAAGQRVANHRFLSAVIDLPDDQGMLATGTIGLAANPWLADHAAAGVVILPAMAYLDIVFQGAILAGGGPIAELTIPAPMRLAPEATQELRLRIGRTEADGGRPFLLHARPSGGQDKEQTAWTLHASGHLAAPGDPTTAATLDVWPPQGAEALDIAALRTRLDAAGYGYGPAFRGLERAWRRGTETFVEANLPEGLSAADHLVHPALLDTALHPIAVRSSAEPESLRLPFSISGARCRGRCGNQLRARLRETDAGAIEVVAFDADGVAVVEIGGLILREVNADGLRRLAAPTPGQDDLLEMVWTPLQPDGAPSLPATAVVGTAGIGSALSVFPHHADFQALGMAVADGAACPDLVVWEVDATERPEDGRTPATQARLACVAVVAALQGWLADDRLSQTRLLAVTRRAVAVERDEAVDMVAAATWQLLHSAQTENPERLILLDVDAPLASGEPVARLWKSGCGQAALRGGTLSRPSLRRIATQLALPRTSHWRLDVDPSLGLDGLMIREAPEAARPLAAGEIRIDVRAAGLNFYDTVYALGLIPLQQAFGAEAAGLVVEIGPGVTRMAVGDRVMVMAEGAYGPVLVADQRLAIRIDDRWTFAEAAAIPAAFVTAYRAITEVAQARAGERILIHAGAGGVGQAAIQIARHLGLEIFATAHPSKWSVLKSLGLRDDHIASSRNLDFAAAFRAATGGAGMDVVLNSLAGDFTDATLDLTAEGGRIVELGKSDIRSADDLARSHPHLSYRHLDGRGVFEPDRTAEVLDALWSMFEAGAIGPLPVVAYDVREAKAAFRLMQFGRHTGKIVLTIPRGLDPAGSVLITGATGTLGALLARHLVERHNVRSLVLASRTGPAADGADLLRRDLEAMGANVRIEACDVADPASLGRLLEQVPPTHPLTAVFHAAGALADATIGRLTPQNFEDVFRPKADAAWLLHEMTRGADLAAFVMYSSTAGTLGNPGQGNYAAANAFLDALARTRRRAGLAGLAAGWGWWQPKSGMLRSEGTADDARIARSGLAPISADHGTALLDAMLALPHAAVLASPVDLERLRANARLGSIHPLFAALAGATGTGDAALAAGAGALRARLAGKSRKRQLDQLRDLVREHAASILGLTDPASSLGDTPFRDAGLDSLMALELRNRLSWSTGLRLPATLVYDLPTPLLLAEHLRTALFPAGDTGKAAERPSGIDEDARLREILGSLTTGRLRAAGLLEPLLRLAGMEDGTPPPAETPSETKIRAASVDELLDLARMQEEIE